MTATAALVWFKRDLRVRDHAPLASAMDFERALGLVVIEPDGLESPECDPRHVETGLGWSCARDLAVAQWCGSQGGVHWAESAQTGVVRRQRSRTGWASRRAQRMNAPEAPAVRGFKAASAGATLDSFLGGRGRDYLRTMSNPLTAAEGCSRLGAQLAFGTISMRCVHQAPAARIAATPDRSLAYALRGFASRLRWHCHFMQKLEDEPALEWRNVARCVDGLRPGDGVHEGAIDRERLQAWCEGRTGFPMVDACMRQLRATGWLNFRARDAGQLSRKGGLPPTAATQRRTRAAPDGQGQLF